MGYAGPPQQIIQIAETTKDMTPIWVAVIGGICTVMATAIGVIFKRRQQGDSQ